MGEIKNHSPAAAGKYLTFKLKNEDYGIGILKVREIIGMLPITPVPQAPDHVKGVINLRGKVIPVVDLRLRFGIPGEDYTERTCIVVVDLALLDAAVQMGIVVDGVSEVLNIPEGEIQEAPNFGAALDTRYIRGMARMDGKVKILLDIDRVFEPAEMAGLQAGL
jgi:purine-binding chemotaxis protein CheW